MEKTNYCWRIIFLYGITLGIALVIHALLIFWTSYVAQYSFIVTHLLMFIVTFAGLYEYRKQQNGLLSRLEGWKIGFFINVVASFIVAIYTYFYIRYFDMDEIRRLVSVIQSQISATSIFSEKEKQLQIVLYRDYLFTPLGLGIVNFFSNVVFGFLLSIMATVFLYKKEKNDSETEQL